jgi:hypothetical protein
MTAFRFYFLTRHGHISDAFELRAADAIVALRRAASLADGRRMERCPDAERLQVWPAQPEADRPL